MTIVASMMFVLFESCFVASSSSSSCCPSSVSSLQYCDANSDFTGIMMRGVNLINASTTKSTINSPDDYNINNKHSMNQPVQASPVETVVTGRRSRFYMTKASFRKAIQSLHVKILDPSALPSISYKNRRQSNIGSWVSTIHRGGDSTVLLASTSSSGGNSLTKSFIQFTKFIGSSKTRCLCLLVISILFENISTTLSKRAKDVGSVKIFLCACVLYLLWYASLVPMLFACPCQPLLLLLRCVYCENEAWDSFFCKCQNVYDFLFRSFCCLNQMYPFFVSNVLRLSRLFSMIGFNISLAKIEVSVAYAIWSAMGTVIVSAAGILLFGESCTVMKLLCLSLISIGVIGLNLIS